MIYKQKEAVSTKEYTLMTYIRENYITLILLSALIILLIANRKMKISGLHYVWLMICMTFVLTICGAVETICDTYGWDYRILYFKTTAVYLIYPLTALLELYLIAPIKHKLPMAVPYIAEAVIVLIDLSDTGIVYSFKENHDFVAGPLVNLPGITTVFYAALLAIYSIRFLSKKEISKGCIVLFIVVIAALTVIGERLALVTGYTATVTAIVILIYYFYLAAINFRETQKKLYESRIELEQERTKLLVAQIQPHFIFNSLAAIQSLCYTDGEAAADCIDVFGDYLRANIESLSSDKPIPFDDELKHIKKYIELERAAIDFGFDVTFELGVTGFMIPPLTVQPIAENAIKHGALTRRDGSGKVTIKTEDNGGNIVITVSDNGTGAKLTDKQKEHRSVGIGNARKRLAVQCGGTLDVNMGENGCTAVITLPKTRLYETKENGE